MTITVVSFTGEIVVVTKIILEKQFVLPKYKRMNMKIRKANRKQLRI